MDQRIIDNLNSNYVFGLYIDQHLTQSDLDTIFVMAHQKKMKMQEIKIEDIIKVIAEVSEFWMNEESFLYKITLKHIDVGFSEEMKRLAIRELAKIFTYENLKKKLILELGNIDMLDQWVDIDSSIKMKIFPLGLLAHITPGNVFVSSIDSLINGILTKNINIVKTSSKVGNTFGVLWIESLKMIEKKLNLEGLISDKIALFSYKGEEFIHYLNEYVDALVVWGGLETIKYFVKNFDPTKKLITFGPKYSISVIDKDVLEDNIDSDEFYEALAWDICLWEQRACSSVQKIYIIGKLENSYLERFSKKLSDKLKNFFIERGELSFDEYTELFKYEEINIAHEVLDKGKYFDSVFWDYYIGSLTIGPLNRMVYVNNVDSIDELCSYLKKSSTILQSCSMKTNNSKNRELYINKLANCGITRFVDIGNIGFNEIFIPHEGEFILRRFSKLVSSYVKDNH
jgi:hypothetical protein